MPYFSSLLTTNNMRQRFHSNLVLFLLSVLGLTPSARAQLSGNYTIKGSGSNNFSSWADFAKTFNQQGVKGAVYVKVMGHDSASSSIELKQHSSNSTSKKDSLVIDGNGYHLYGTGSYSVLKWNGLDHVYMNRMTLIHAGSSSKGSCLQLCNGADSNRIDSCSFYFKGLTITNADFSAHVAFGFTDTLLTKSNWKHQGIQNTVTRCRMGTLSGVGPRYAIVDIQGDTAYASIGSNNTFISNKITNFFTGAIYGRYLNNESFIGNIINRSDATSSTSMDSICTVINLANLTNSKGTVQVRQNKISELPIAFSSKPKSSVALVVTLISVDKAWVKNSGSGILIKSNVIQDIYAHRSITGVSITSAHNAIVQENTIKRLYTLSQSYSNYGIYANDVLNPKINQNTIKHCMFDTASYTAAFMVQVQNVTSGSSGMMEFNDNLIDSNTAGYYMYVTYIYGNPNYPYNIDMRRNRITFNKSTYQWGFLLGLYLIYPEKANVVSNVLARNYSPREVLLSEIIGTYLNASNSELNVMYNTFSHNDSNNFVSTYLSLMSYVYGFGDINFVGNVIDAHGGGQTYMAYLIGNNLKEVDHNSLWSDGTFSAEYYYMGSTFYSDFASWSADPKAGKYNYWVDPKFYKGDSGDFRCLQGKNQNNVPYTTAFSSIDVDGVKRALRFHDRGAQEIRYNLAISNDSFQTPDTVCAGYSFTGSFWLKNEFVDTLTEVILGRVQNSKFNTETIDVVVPPGDSAQVAFTAPWKLNETGNQTLKVFINTGNDDYSDDSLELEVFVKGAPGQSKVNFSPLAGINSAFYDYNKKCYKTIRGIDAQFNVTSPLGFANADYGKTWKASAFANSAGGKSVWGSSITDPTGTENLKWTFQTNDSMLDDSTVFIHLKVSDLNNGCDTVYTIKLCISPSPEVNFSNPRYICVGDTAHFINQTRIRSTKVYLEYQWMLGSGMAGDTLETTDASWVYPGVGSYPVTLRVLSLPDSFYFFKKDTLTVTVSPTADFSRSNACEGKPILFQNKSTPSTAKMYWDFGKGDTLINASSFGYPISGLGNHLVTLTVKDKGCSSSKTIKVMVYEQPTAKFIQTAGTCLGDTFRFQNQTTMNVSLFGTSWSFDEPNGLSTQKSPSYRFQTAGSKKVRLLIRSEFGCVDSLVKVVDVNEAPKAAFDVFRLCSQSIGEACNQTPAVLGTTYTANWELDGTAHTLGDTMRVDWQQPGKRTIRLLINLDNGCKAELTKEVNVLKEIIPSFVAESQCADDTVFFSNRTPFGETDSLTWDWDFGNGFTSQAFEPHEAFPAIQTLVLNVTLTANLKDGCSSDIVKQIEVWEKPRTCDFIAEPDYEQSFYGLSLNPVNAQGTPGGQDGIDYSWNVKNIGNQNSSNKNATVHYPLPADGSYEITMRASTQEHGCWCLMSKTAVMDRAETPSMTSGTIVLYPNPLAQSTLNLRSSVAIETLELFSQTGQLVFKSEKLKPGTHELSLPDLSAGLYQVRTQSALGSSYQSLSIVQP